ncbi:hypothetical protein [Xenorhabdus sp. BG5]|nr:hypothetical protein [Xenorhabdus sp. BG5]
MATVTRSNLFAGLAGWAVLASQPVQADDCSDVMDVPFFSSK